MPTSKVIILTDPKSKLSINQGRTTILPIEGNYSRGNLMLQRIKSYIVSLCALCKQHFSAYAFSDQNYCLCDLKIILLCNHLYALFSSKILIYLCFWFIFRPF
jgi:hypothetical protein